MISGEKSLLITQNDQISKIDVNLNDVSNAKIDYTRFHFEIPVPFIIKNIPKDVFDYMVVQNGYIKGFQYRYTNHKYIQSDGTIKTGDYLNLLEAPRGGNMNSYHCLYVNQVWSITRHIYGCRMDVNSAIIGRRKGYNYPVLDLYSEKTERYYKCPQGYLTEFSTHASHYAYLSNYSNIKIYSLGGRYINE